MRVKLWHHAALDALWVVLDAGHIVVMVLKDDLGVLCRFDILAALLRVEVLHDDHVAAFAALAEQAACCGSILEWRDDFNDVASQRDFA